MHIEGFATAAYQTKVSMVSQWYQTILFVSSLTGEFNENSWCFCSDPHGGFEH